MHPAMTKKKPKRTKAPEPEKKTFPEVRDPVFRRALEAAGGFTQLGEALKVSRQGVHKWDKIPERFALKLEELYGIPRRDTAPSMFKGM